MKRPTTIARRHVFHLGGYDPIAPGLLVNRFHRSLASFQSNWGAMATASELTAQSDVSASWHADLSGPNWTTHTTFEMLRWDDLILQDFRRGGVSRLVQGLRTLLDFIITGTLARYARSSWRYTSFFLFPYLLVMLFAIGGTGAGWLVSWLLGWGGLAGICAAAAVGMSVFAAAMRWSPWRRTINHAFDDWIFSRQYLYGQRPRMEQRLDAFADLIVARARAADTDEIVIVGHCLGAGLVMQTVARALAKDPQLTAHGPTICVLTVGATIPKFSLHPRGDAVRQATRVVAEQRSIRWAEYHARNDVISFYRFDPVTLTPIAHDRSDGRPNIRRVQIPAMISAESFRRHRSNFMRMHYQFLMGNDQRSAYDYCLIACGPLPFDESTGRDGGLRRIGADGALTGRSSPPAKAVYPVPPSVKAARGFA